ncbi:MAG: hypothetical protein IMF08_03110 [Proteobacteria bacterium]|nr:hypothetical protein [Pseudomonadota bacterium]
MAQIAYNDVVDILLERFPEFKETEDFKWGIYLDLSYSVWGAFGRYITTYMNRLPADRVEADELVNRVFDFANEMMDGGDDDTQTIVVIELFENFYTYRKTLELGQRKLKPQHVTWLERQGVWLGTCDLHYEGELVAPNGLDSLRSLVSGCSWDVRLTRPHRDALPRLESNATPVDLRMDPGPGPHHTFFGDAEREADARRLLGEFSERIAHGDIAHRIRLYRTGKADILLEDFRHRWRDDDPAKN